MGEPPAPPAAEEEPPPAAEPAPAPGPAAEEKKAEEKKETGHEPLTHFTITVDKGKGGAKLGLDTSSNTRENFLRVQKVKAGGLVDTWNKENPQYEVKQSDEIEEVNGKRGGRDVLYDTIAKDQVLVMKIHRPS